MGKNDIIDKLRKNTVSDILGKFTIFTFFLSFFIWTGGLKYSVWVGLIALIIKKFKYKEKIEIGPKILAYSNIYIFLGTLAVDIITFKSTHHIVAHDRYNIFLMYFVLINFINSKKELDKLMVVWGISAIISYLGAIPGIKIFLKDPTFRIESFYDIMSFSHALATASIFFLGIFIFNSRGKWRVFYGLIYAVAIIMIFLTQTRGAILATISAQVLLLLYILVINKKIMYLAILLILILSLSSKFMHGVVEGFGHRSKGASNDLRVIFWKASIYGYKKNPLIGTGFDGTGPMFEEYIVKTNQVDYVVANYSGGLHGNSHNEYLANLMRYGTIVGGYLILYLLTIIPYVYIKNRNKINEQWKKYYIFLPFTFCSFYISALTETVLVSKTGNIFIVSLSIMAISIMKSSKDSEYKKLNEV